MRRRTFAGGLAVAVSILGLAVLASCSHPQATPNAADGSESPSAKTANAATKSEDPGIDLQCTADSIQKADAPFHWSYKKDDSSAGSTAWEADVTADSIQGTMIDANGTRRIQATRADASAWDNAVLMLSGPLPASTVALVNHSSSTVRIGKGQANGQDAIKYSIDTTRAAPADASLINSVMGQGSSIKGTAWVTGKGCLVKFVLDVEDHMRDGSVEKERYEANVTRK